MLKVDEFEKSISTVSKKIEEENNKNRYTKFNRNNIKIYLGNYL